MDNFEFFTEQDKTDTAYNMCVAGSTITGMAVGATGAVGVGALPGAIVGLIIGLKTCNRIAPALKKKIFSDKVAITELELSQVLKHLREKNPTIAKESALKALAEVRGTVNAMPWDFSVIV